MGSFLETYHDPGFWGYAFLKARSFSRPHSDPISALVATKFLKSTPPVNVTFTTIQSLTKNRYCSPYIIELIVKTGFQSSLKIKEF